MVIQLGTEYHTGGVLEKIYRVLPSFPETKKITYVSTDIF